eukprot:TRINITY_DN14243_c0_g1_i1.p1 TRINITY_DN14243_c0_g1~~TRINITY_DN14243_c0_g1_i1.p1  ORF type:complete len:160 (+),score=29.89 TRINITY_DN14243_c0_g1_i1:45-524(+)
MNTSVLLLLLAIVVLTVAPKPPQKQKPKIVTKDKAWFEGVLKLMEAGNHPAWKATYHPEVNVLFNMVKQPTSKYVQAFPTYEYTNCKVGYVHTKGRNGAIVNWSCDFKDKQTDKVITPLEVTDEYEFDEITDRILIMKRKYPKEHVKYFRDWQKPKLEL